MNVINYTNCLLIKFYTNTSKYNLPAGYFMQNIPASKKLINTNKTMNRIGLLYGPEGGSTDDISELIAERIGLNNIERNSFSQLSKEKIEQYDKMIIGLPTLGGDSWDTGSAGESVSNFLAVIEKIDFSGKTIALYGLGNSVTYSKNFVDDMGVLAEKLSKNGATLVGAVSTEGYEFDASEAVIDNTFVGLAIDEDTESEKTEERIDAWIEIIKPALGF